MVYYRFTNILCLRFSHMFPWFSHIFPYFPNRFPMVSHIFQCFPIFSHNGPQATWAPTHQPRPKNPSRGPALTAPPASAERSPVCSSSSSRCNWRCDNLQYSIHIIITYDIFKILSKYIYICVCVCQNIVVSRLCRIVCLPRWTWCLAMSQHNCKAQGQARQTFSAATCRWYIRTSQGASEILRNCKN